MKILFEFKKILKLKCSSMIHFKCNLFLWCQRWFFSAP